jgi:uncharacterized protein (TIGR03790 family)
MITLKYKKIMFLLVLTVCANSYALEPQNILLITNSEIAESGRIASYYCQKRAVPAENIIALPLGSKPATSISRQDYNVKLAEPVRKTLNSEKFKGKIKCLLTIYGVPYIVEGRGQLPGKEKDLKSIESMIEQGKKLLATPPESNTLTIKPSPTEKKIIEEKLAQLQLVADIIVGKETSASVDSELSMVLFPEYELYRWQINCLQTNIKADVNESAVITKYAPLTMMVSRLDGPGEKIITGLVDKAISAEQNGLKGTVYIDSRGLTSSDEYGLYDQSLRELSVVTKLRTKLPVVQEPTSRLFAAGECPQTVIYCGWYSVGKYINAFDFVDGAIGYHIASYEAQGLRDPNASNWCPAMLVHGITATLGPVEEPYLHSFPKPKDFFSELYNGFCLVEAYYHTNPLNSWKQLLIGDPLYKPFKKTQTSGAISLPQ